ncbi:MAG: hypothetical protein QM630_05450 [Microbacterium sp.]
MSSTHVPGSFPVFPMLPVVPVISSFAAHAIRMVQLNKDEAGRQVKLIEDACASLGASKVQLEGVAAGQTTSVWTADGKCVELAAVLTARYNALLAWRDALDAQLDRAKENLVLAIDSTTKFDEATQQEYIDRLNKADAASTSGTGIV